MANERKKATPVADESIDVKTLSPEEQSLLAGLRDLQNEFRKDPEGTPAEDKKPDEFRKEELLSIFDALITANQYIEPVKVGNRLSIVWRTRTAEESNKITAIIDSAGFNMIMAVQNHTNLLNMAYSLVAFNGKDYSDKSVTERHKALQALPEIIIIALADSLAKFDYKVAKAVEVGRENF